MTDSPAAKRTVERRHAQHSEVTEGTNTGPQRLQLGRSQLALARSRLPGRCQGPGCLLRGRVCLSHHVLVAGGTT